MNKIFQHLTDIKLQRQADKDCRQLEIIKEFLILNFKLNEIDALILGLELIDLLKKRR